MKDERLLKLGQKIRYERLKKGFSQERLEEKSLVSRRAISEIEEAMPISGIQIFCRLLRLSGCLFLSCWILNYKIHKINFS